MKNEEMRIKIPICRHEHKKILNKARRFNTIYMVENAGNNTLVIDVTI